MSTLALPISELEHRVAAAHRDTRHVARYAKKHTQTAKRLWRISKMTLRLAWRFRATTACQALLIGELTKGDFNTAALDAMGSLARSISELVLDEREILDEA